MKCVDDKNTLTRMMDNYRQLMPEIKQSIISEQITVEKLKEVKSRTFFYNFKATALLQLYSFLYSSVNFLNNQNKNILVNYLKSSEVQKKFKKQFENLIIFVWNIIYFKLFLNILHLTFLSSQKNVHHT